MEADGKLISERGASTVYSCNVSSGYTILLLLLEGVLKLGFFHDWKLERFLLLFCFFFFCDLLCCKYLDSARDAANKHTAGATPITTVPTAPAADIDTSLARVATLPGKETIARTALAVAPGTDMIAFVVAVVALTVKRVIRYGASTVPFMTLPTGTPPWVLLRGDWK